PPRSTGCALQWSLRISLQTVKSYAVLANASPVFPDSQSGWLTSHLLTAPLAGQALSEFAQATGGLGERGFFRPEVLGQRKSLGHPGTGRFTVARFVPAAHHDA